MCGCRKNAATRSVQPQPEPQAPPAPRAIPAPRAAPAPRAVPAPRAAPVPRPMPAPMAVPAAPRQRTGNPMQRMLSRRSAPATTRTGLAIVDTSVWGPPLWKVLHTVAATVPATWQTIHTALRDALPCPECDAHFNAWYATRPPPGPDGAAQWLLDLHNNVNSRTGTPMWTAEQLAAQYTATPESLSAARTTLASLKGIIGASAYDALAAAL